MVMALFLLAHVPASSVSKVWAPNIPSSPVLISLPIHQPFLLSGAVLTPRHFAVTPACKLNSLVSLIPAILHSDFIQHLFLDAATLENLQQQSLEETRQDVMNI